MNPVIPTWQPIPAATRRRGKPFIGVDFEGVGEDPHRLILVGASPVQPYASQWRPAEPSGAAYSTDWETEPWHWILMWLLKQQDRGHLVGWWIDYDVSLLVGMLPTKAQERLAATGLVRVGYWEIEHRPGRFFSAWWRGPAAKHGRRRVMWWDIGPTAGNLLNAIRSWKIQLPPGAWALLEEGKAARDGWANWTWERIAEYNALECQATAAIAERIREVTYQLGLTVRSWTVGGISQALLTARGNMGPEWPEPWADIAAEAVYGGRHEAQHIGPTRRVTHLDINSAYAAAMVDLPCLRPDHGVQPLDEPGVPDSGEWLGLVTWNLKEDSFGPFPVRRRRNDEDIGSLIYPSVWSTPRWYWGREIEAAMWAYSSNAGARYDQPEGITVHRTKVLRPCLENCPPPLAWLADLYADRQATDIPGAEKLMKLVLAAVWGKLNQMSGARTHRHTAAAGLVTAHVRGQLLMAARTPAARSKIVAISADGIATTSPSLLRVTEGNGLGEWRRSNHVPTSWFQAQAGLAWAGTRVRTRGFGAQQIRDQQAAIELEFEASGTDARVDIPGRRFRGYRLAASLGDITTANRWEEHRRRLSLSPRPRRIPAPQPRRPGNTRPPNEAETLTSILTDQSATPRRRKIDETPGKLYV